MSRINCVIILLLSLGISSLASSRASSQGSSPQWRKVATFNGYINFIRFIDANVGYIGIGIAPGSLSCPNGFYRTSDGGNTWKSVTFPSGYKGVVTDVAMQSPAIGWASVIVNGAGRSMVWKTLDSGHTWIETSSGAGYGTSVCITARSIVVTDLLSQGLTSVDGGATWRRTLPSGTNCARFVDSMHGSMGTYRGNVWTYTNDGGLTWKNTAHKVEAWYVYPVENTPNLYSAPEGPTDGSPYTPEIFKSSDYGVTWAPICRLNCLPTGTLKGVRDEVMYFQVCAWQEPRVKGFYESRDKGVTWSPIGGPSAMSDTRFEVREHCGKNSIWAFDSKNPGSLWTYSVLGVDSMSFTLTQRISMTAPNLCLKPTGVAAISNLSCDTLTVTALSLSDSSVFDLSAIQLPYHLMTGDSLRIGVKGDAKSAGRFKAKLRMTLSFQNTIKDTTVELTLITDDPSLQLDRLALKVRDRCVQLDTSLGIRNMLCDTVRLLSVELDDTTAFHLTEHALPETLLSNDASTIRLRTAAMPKGVYKTVLKLRFMRAQTLMDTAIELSLEVEDVEQPRLALQTRLDHGNVSEPCDRSTRRTTLINAGCSTMQVLSAKIVSGQSDFSLAARQYPMVIPEGRMDSIEFVFAPTALGKRTGKVLLEMKLAGARRDTMIELTGTGIAIFNERLLTPVLAFDTITTCTTTSKDAAIVNASCSPITLDGAMIFGVNGFEIVSPRLPVTIAPQDTLHLTVRFTPLMIGEARDSIRVELSGDGGGGMETIQLQAFAQAPTRRIELSANALHLENISPCHPQDSSIVIRNRNACEDITIDHVTVAGYPVSTSTALLPMLLHPGDSLVVRFTLSPPENKSVTSTISIFGSGIDTTALIGYSGKGTAKWVVSGIDPTFTTRICSALAKTYKIESRGCGSITVDSIALYGASANSGFVVSDAPALPLTLDSGQLATFTLTFDPGSSDVRRISSGDPTRLRLHSTDGALDEWIELTAAAIGTAPEARIGLSPRDAVTMASLAPGGLVDVDVKLLDDIGDSTALRTIDYVITYDANALTLATVTAGNGWMLGQSSELVPGELHYQLVRGDVPLRNGTPLMSARFQVMLSEDSTSSVQLSGVHYNVEDPSYESCMLRPLSVAEPIKVNVLSACGDGIIRQMMRKTLAVELLSVYPNPVTTAGQPVTVQLASAEGAQVWVAITDMMGHELYRKTLDVGKGRTEMRLVLPDLAEGEYLISLLRDGLGTDKQIVSQSRKLVRVGK